MRKVEVVPYNKNWPNQFRQEAKLIKELTGKNLINNEIQRHIALKEYLIHDKTKRQEYSETKSFLAKKFPKDIENYIKGKDALVKRLEQEVLIFKWQLLKNSLNCLI
ncbi:GrpB family protein [Enterococcus sp. LJL120]